MLPSAAATSFKLAAFTVPASCSVLTLLPSVMVSTSVAAFRLRLPPETNCTPSSCTVPPVCRTSPVAVPPAATISNPPAPMVVPLVAAPAETTSTPPERMVVPLATAPFCNACTPPEIVTPTA